MAKLFDGWLPLLPTIEQFSNSPNRQYLMLIQMSHFYTINFTTNKPAMMYKGKGISRALPFATLMTT